MTMENQTPSYVYVACARGEKRTHAQSTAEHVRYSVENMLHPVFLATEKNKHQHTAALQSADILVLTDSDPAALADETVREALSAFQTKPQGRIVVYSKSDALAKKIDGAQFIGENSGAIRELLSSILDLPADREDEFAMPNEEEAPAPAGKFDNLKNIAFICGFIAAVCLLFRLVMMFLKK